MQNTYERILKYLIEHDVNLELKYGKEFTVVSLAHKTRNSMVKILTKYAVLSPEILFSAIEERMALLFPSFKDFDTPIKGI